MERRETKEERENVDYNVNHKRDPQPATFSAYLECRSVSLDTIDRDTMLRETSQTGISDVFSRVQGEI